MVRETGNSEGDGELRDRRGFEKFSVVRPIFCAMSQF